MIRCPTISPLSGEASVRIASLPLLLIRTFSTRSSPITYQ
nr:MAG TPA: hypothetical protein [Caudoviricetes sp.]